MSTQDQFHMPKTGEGWRHYKGGLYIIVGMARDSEGDAVVVYSDYIWSLAQRAPLYVQRLDRFLHEIEKGKPRFDYERPVGSVAREECQYINNR